MLITDTSPGVHKHADLNDLAMSGHPQHTLVNGTVPFTGVVGGIVPIADTHLTTKAYVDALTIPVNYVPDSLNVAVGVTVEGDVDSIKVRGDEDILHVEEIANTPGFNLEINFASVLEVPNQLELYAYYDGAAGHTVEVQLYDQVGLDWDVLEVIPDGGEEPVRLVYEILDGAKYVKDDDTVEMRIYHTSPGNPNHDIYIDLVMLRKMPPAGGGATSSHLQLGDVHPDQHHDESHDLTSHSDVSAKTGSGTSVVMSSAPTILSPLLTTNPRLRSSGFPYKYVDFDLDSFIAAGATRTLIFADQDMDMRPDAGTYAAASHVHAQVDALLPFFNDIFLESFDALVTSADGTITLSLEQTGGGNLTMVFSDGHATLDCTPAATIELTAGIGNTPQKNFICIPQSTKVLTKSLMGFPVAEHIKVGYFCVQSAAKVEATGALGNQNWNDHASETAGAGVGQGHLAHIVSHIRRTNSVYASGIDLGVDIVGASTPDDVFLTTTAGVVWQMHPHAYPAHDSDPGAAGDLIHVANDSVTPYDAVNNLNGKLLDAAGVSMANAYYNLVIWSVANKTGEYSPLFINLPTGSYSTLTEALLDVDGYDVSAIPDLFLTDAHIGFLIARVTLKHSASGGGTWTLENTKDLRQPSEAVGGGGTMSHAVLDGSVHSDTADAAVSSNAIVVGNSTPKWDKLTVGEQTLVGRITGGNVAALVPAQVRAMLQLQQSKVFTLKTPVAGECYKLAKIPWEGILYRVNYRHLGGTNVIFNLYINNEDQFDDDGTKVWTDDKTSTSSNVVITSFDNDAMAQYYTLWIEIVSTSGNVPRFLLDHVLRET